MVISGMPDVEYKENPSFHSRHVFIFPVVPIRERVGPIDWTQAFDEMVEDEARTREIDAWAAEHLTDYEVINGRIGIADPDEAFWFKMRWL